jgi:Ca2+-transporting ATPase
MAALALATDPPPDSVFDRKPEPRNVSLITTTMWKMIILQSIFQLTVTLVLHFAGPSFLPGSSYDDRGKMQTLVFNVFVWMQIFNAINSRRIDNRLNIFEGFFKNKLFMGIFLAMVGGQALIVNFGTYVFAVEAITGAQWAISIVIGFLAIPIGALIRIIPDAWYIWCVHRIIPAKVRSFFSSKRNKDRMPLHPEEEFRGEWNRSLLKIKSDLARYQRVRGGRFRLIRQNLKYPKQIMKKSRSGSKPNGSPMPSALGMPGVVAGSIGGFSPVERRSINPDAEWGSTNQERDLSSTNSGLVAVPAVEHESVSAKKKADNSMV